MKIIGHRGAKGLAPENTLASFEAAIEHHVDEVEFDLHVTSDGIPILNHDPFITGTDQAPYIITEHTYKELHEHTADLLRFDELLRAIGHSVHLLIEIKPQVATGPIIDCIREAVAEGRSPDTLSVSSFDQAVLRAVHAALPDMQMIITENWSSIRARRRAREVHTKRINMSERWLWRGFLRAMHHGGYQIATYTVNDPARVRKWEPYLYGVITDYPDRFRHAPQRRK
jgi:glycerophosphoryl diester phosphodiesterase